MQLKNRTENSTKAVFVLGSIMLYFLLSMIKMNYYLFEGRFWAEEGYFFVRGIYPLGFFDALFWVYHGHLEVATNLVVYLSSLVVFECAPLVTTYLSLALQSLPVILVVMYRMQLGLSKWQILAWIVIIVGMPQGNEVWANSINLHFHFALLVAIIAAVKPNIRSERYAFRALLLVSGLSGIPANTLSPVFLFLAIKEKDRERKVQFLILAITSLIQIAFLLFSSSRLGVRTYDFDPVILVLATINQSFNLPLYGSGVGRHLGTIFSELTLKGKVAGIIFAAMYFIPIAYFFKGLRHHGKQREWVLLSCAVILIVMGFGLALGRDRVSMIYDGGRYWYASNVLIYLLILVVIKEQCSRIISIFLVLLLASSLNSIFRDRIIGPPWIESYRQSVYTKDERILIWPSGSYMRFPEKNSRE